MSEFQNISVDQVKEFINKQPVTIVDIRDEHSFNVGALPNAVHLGDGNVEEFMMQANKEIPLVCYCYHGHSSQRAAVFFKNQGFKEVYSMDGGYEKWRESI